ncbi:hypothetical protein BC829DRAFT_419053 [Chytridium lagenaria]|nr:hypothetical protein BC829DRAFT_419053 [Chytridium lagenaria]
MYLTLTRWGLFYTGTITGKSGVLEPKLHRENFKDHTLYREWNRLTLAEKDRLKEDAAKIFELFKNRKLIPTTEDIEIISREVVKRTADLIEVHGMAYFLNEKAKIDRSRFIQLASWGIVKTKHDDSESSGGPTRTANTLSPVDVEARRRSTRARFLRLINEVAAPRVYTEVWWKDLKQFQEKHWVLLGRRRKLSFEEESSGQDDAEDSTDDDRRDPVDRDDVDDGDAMELALDDDLDEEDEESGDSQNTDMSESEE